MRTLAPYTEEFFALTVALVKSYKSFVVFIVSSSGRL
jgi:hypothetical protein